MWCWKTQTYTCDNRGPLGGNQIYQQCLDRVHDHDGCYTNCEGGVRGEGVQHRTEVNLQMNCTISRTAIVTLDLRAQP